MKQTFEETTELIVSVICTTYNHEAYIKDALEGFVMQKTNFTFEIIVHDDASTDSTAKIIKEYEEKYPDLFVTIYQTENQYSKKEVNIWTDILYPVARGKYIAICEGDDYWTDPFKLQKQFNFLTKNKDYSLVFTDTDILYTHSGKVIKAYNYSNRKNSPIGDVFPQLIYSNPYRTCTAFFRKSSIENFSSFYKGKQFMMFDWGLWLYISKFHKIGYMNESTAVYRILPSSASHFQTYKEFKAYIESANQLRDYFVTESNYNVSSTKVFLINLRAFGSYIIKNKKYKDYFLYLLQYSK
jgi:glycosyltransferase involved in cell wall biosynthesis